MNETTSLTYLRYLNGYIKVESKKQQKITWLDVLKTFSMLFRINIRVLSFNLKSMIQHTKHLDFSFYLPSDLETFCAITLMLKKFRRKRKWE